MFDVMEECERCPYVQQHDAIMEIHELRGCITEAAKAIVEAAPEGQRAYRCMPAALSDAVESSLRQLVRAADGVEWVVAHLRASAALYDGDEMMVNAALLNAAREIAEHHRSRPEGSVIPGHFKSDSFAAAVDVPESEGGE